jgi:hypothetical protein
MGCGCKGGYRSLNRVAIPARNIIRAVNTSQQRQTQQYAALPPLPVVPPENAGTMTQERLLRAKTRRDAVLNQFGRS